MMFLKHTFMHIYHVNSKFMSDAKLPIFVRFTLGTCELILHAERLKDVTFNFFCSVIPNISKYPGIITIILSAEPL